MSRAKDHTGVRYGIVVGLRPTEKRMYKQIVWEWQCDCGEVFEMVAGNFLYRGTGSCEKCGKLNAKVATIAAKTTHGMTKTKEYKSWTKIRERCYDENSKDYPQYGGAGVVVHPEWIGSFEAFYAHIGDIPSDGHRYSCDRIDNDGDYVPGNVRWARYTQQARNKSKMKNNTSGHTGVVIDEKSPGKFYAKAQWQDLNGKLCTRSFSFKTYGEELALLCAIEARDKAIRLLNQQGAGYSPKHGK